MPIRRLEPVDLSSHHWNASTRKEPVVIRAPDEGTARTIATMAFANAVQAVPGRETAIIPWGQPDLVSCTQLEQSEFEEDGPDAILDPPELNQTFGEGKVNGARFWTPDSEILFGSGDDSKPFWTAGNLQAHTTEDPGIGADEAESSNFSTAEETDEAKPSSTAATPGTGETVLEGQHTTVRVQQGTELTADPGDRIRLSDPDVVPIAAVKEQHLASLEKLSELRDTLDELHGEDAPDTPDGRNTRQVPLSEDELQLLRAIVDSSIALHRSPSLPRQAIEALKTLWDCLVGMKAHLDKLSETFDSLKGLAFKVGEAVLAIKELLDILGVTS